MIEYNGEGEPEVLEPLSNYLENLGVQLAKMIIQALMIYGSRWAVRINPLDDPINSDLC